MKVAIILKWNSNFNIYSYTSFFFSKTIIERSKSSINSLKFYPYYSSGILSFEFKLKSSPYSSLIFVKTVLTGKLALTN